MLHIASTPRHLATSKHTRPSNVPNWVVDRLRNSQNQTFLNNVFCSCARVKIFEVAYYRDGADAYEMIKHFVDEQRVFPSCKSYGALP